MNVDISPIRLKRERKELKTVKRILRYIKDELTLSLDKEIEKVTSIERYKSETVRPMSDS